MFYCMFYFTCDRSFTSWARSHGTPAQCEKGTDRQTRTHARTTERHALIGVYPASSTAGEVDMI